MPTTLIDGNDIRAEFLEDVQLDWAGFFPYSAEPGTPAAELDGQISRQEIEERLRHLQEIQEEMTASANLATVGDVTSVLVDQVEDLKRMVGILENQLYSAGKVPNMPSTPPVLPVEILGQVYEQFLGKVIRHSGWSTDKVIRFFHRGHGRYPDRRVHADLDIEGPTPVLRNPLLHYTFRSLDQYWEKLRNYGIAPPAEGAEEAARAGARRSDEQRRPALPHLRPSASGNCSSRTLGSIRA